MPGVGKTYDIYMPGVGTCVWTWELGNKLCKIWYIYSACKICVNLVGTLGLFLFICLVIFKLLSVVLLLSIKWYELRHGLDHRF